MKKGFTLIELIASLAIFSLAMVGITMAFSASLSIRQRNDVKQSTVDYSQAIIEKFRVVGYANLDNIYKGDITTGVSTFVYFNKDMSNFNLWFQYYIKRTTQVAGNVNSSTYPLSTGNQFGALIKIAKTSVAGGGMPYHIYVRVWRLDRGAQSQSVRDIYESR